MVILLVEVRIIPHWTMLHLIKLLVLQTELVKCPS